MKAIFKGENGSLGFVTGQEYSLSLSRHRAIGSRVDGVEITTISNERLLYCQYNTVKGFLDNWELV